MISKRLLEIASMIDKNKVVFDVGSDHALLPCFLLLNNISNKVYAADNKQGPLDQAIKNISKYNLNDKVIPVLSDGLDKVSDDVEIVVIAGMGYHTIKHILDKADISNYDSIIVQTNSDVDLLRRYISMHNYTIIDEKIVYDDFYYQIIKFNTQYHEEYDELQIKYGPILLNKHDEIFINFLNNELKRLQAINLKANNPEYSNKIKQIKEILYN